jgi:NADH dehydrogenase FAD-containing subunit
MELLSFKKCFENTETYELFSKFLAKSHNLELLHFFELVQDFNLLMNQTFKEKRAITIYQNFLVKDSPEEINISGDALRETLRLYELAVQKKILFDSSIFDPCFKIVSHDLINDAFARFRFSPDFMEYINKKKQELSEKEFSDRFLDTEIKEISKEQEEKKKISEAEMTMNIIMQQDPLQMLTSKIIFKDDELSQMEFTDNYTPNKMIIDMMKPFTGVALSTPKFTTVEKKKSVFSQLKISMKKENEVKEELKKMRKFSYTAFKEWLETYLQKNVSEIRISKILQTLEKYKVITSLSSQYYDYNFTDYFYFAKKKQLVIIGSGYGGITAANELKNDFEVICIDKQKEFSFRNSYYTLFSNPMKIQDLEYSMTDLVSGWTYIQANVRNISASAVFLDDDKVIPFDYLIIATGAHYFVPFEISQKPFAPKFPGDKYDETKEQLESPDIKIVIPYNASNIISSYPILRKAKRIIVLGTGAVGCEAIGEIAATYPKCKVTVLTQSQRLLEKYQSQKIHQTATKILEEYGNIEFLFQKAIIRVEGKRVYFKDISENLKSRKIIDSIEADALVNCLGLRPTTHIFKPFMSDSLNAKGFVQVNEYLQVKHGQYKNETLNEIEEIWNSDSLSTLSRCNSSFEEFQKNVKSPRDQTFTRSLSVKLPKNGSSQSLDEESPDSSVEHESVDSSQISKITNLIELVSLEEERRGLTLIDNGYENIYAIGDIVDLTKVEKLAFHAMEHAKRVANNIRTSEFSETMQDFQKKAIKYTIDESVVQSIALGKKGIIIQGKSVIQQGLTNKYKEDVQTKQLEDFILRCQVCQFKFGNFCEIEPKKKK